MRAANVALVTDLVRAEGPLTRADLVRRTGLTRPTVMAIVQKLVQDEVLVQAGTDVAAQQGGRPGSLLAFNPLSVTVAVGRLMSTFIDVRLGDAYGRQLLKKAVASPPDPCDLPAAMADLLEELSSLTRPSPLGAIAILAPGRIDPTAGASVTLPILGWTDLPVGTVLAERLKVPVTVLSPAAASVLAACAGRADANAVVVFLDEGIGVGILTHDRLLRGATGAAGELGHCRVPGNQRRCRCGMVGCLETVASGWAITDQVAGILGPSAEPPRTLAAMEALPDPRVHEVLERAADQLGLAVSWLVNIVNPTTVLLGGTPFASGATRFLDRFQAAVQTQTAATNRTGLVVDFADDRAALDGAFRAALNLLPGRDRWDQLPAAAHQTSSRRN